MDTPNIEVINKADCHRDHDRHHGRGHDRFSQAFVTASITSPKDAVEAINRKGDALEKELCDARREICDEGGRGREALLLFGREVFDRFGRGELLQAQNFGKLELLIEKRACDMKEKCASENDRTRELIRALERERDRDEINELKTRILVLSGGILPTAKG